MKSPDIDDNELHELTITSHSSDLMNETAPQFQVSNRVERTSDGSSDIAGELAVDMARPFGRRRFVQGVGAAAGVGALATVLPAMSASGLATGASAFAALPRAVRVVDTRSPGNYQFNRASDVAISVPIAGSYGVPVNATAIVATLTGVNQFQPNFVTMSPSGRPVPVVSNLNLPFAFDINANLATVKLGGGGVDITSLSPCDVILDVLGYYAPVDGPVAAGRFVGLSAARRAIDTRPDAVGDNSITEVDVTDYIPAEAGSLVMNLTATECTLPGFCTVFPYTETDVPGTSSLNFTQFGETRASSVIVPVSTIGGRRKIKIFTLRSTKLIVDVTGYFTGDNSLPSNIGLFVPVEPTRILDTRLPQFQPDFAPGGVLWPDWSVEGRVPGAAGTDASAIVVNVTGTATRGPGFLTISAARQPIPGTSNVNWSVPGTTVPNHAITPITVTHGYQVYSSHGAAVIVDLAGYFVGSPKLPSIGPRVNPPPPPIGPPWWLEIPKLGLGIWVYDGDAKRITDSGFAWHWTGTGLMGQNASVAIFGHRTEAGAPLYYLDQMENGDRWSISTIDGRRYTYEVVRRDLADTASRSDVVNNSNVLDATRFHGSPSLSLVACTVGFDATKSRYPDAWAPTSLKYRIVVTGQPVNPGFLTLNW
jgi:sortase (surface protein transpeptidase)